MTACRASLVPRSPPRSPSSPSPGAPLTPRTHGGHTHPNGQQVSLPVGDGTTAAEVGYRLDDVRLPRSAETTGEVSFRIDDFRGDPVTDFLVEQTKDLHLYVVRSDLGVFRHLHPTMADDGTWTAPVSLPGSGSYRVIAEFVARDDGGNGDHLVLGQPVDVPGGPESKADPTDPVVTVEVAEAPRTRSERTTPPRRPRRPGPAGEPRHLPRRVRARHRLPDARRGRCCTCTRSARRGSPRTARS